MNKKTSSKPYEGKNPSNFPEQNIIADSEEIIVEEEIDPDTIPDEEITPPPYEEPPPGEGP